MPLRKPANLPAPTGPNFKVLSPLFLQYENGSNLVYKQLYAISIDTERRLVLAVWDKADWLVF